MSVFHDSFSVKSDTRPTFDNVTEQVKACVKKANIRDGIVLVYSQHTTCSVLIQEASDDLNYYGTDYLMEDLLEVLEKIIPRCQTENQYHHPGPKHIEAAKRRNEEPCWSLNTDAHLRSVIMGRSQSIPLINNELVLGEFGVIYFADFDQVRARERTVHVQIVGDC